MLAFLDINSTRLYYSTIMSSGINVIASTFDASEENTTLFRQIMEKK